jgi:hypothetical protein
MEKPNALDFFRGEPRYNCAQAILKAYAPAVGAGESCLDRFAKFGSGRAPGGECGALFAAKAIVADSSAKKEIERAFVEIARTTKCREIRQGRRLSCEQCVQIAADAVFDRLAQHCLLQPPSECVS